MNRRNFVKSVVGFFTAAFFVKGSEVEAKERVVINKNTSCETFRNKEIVVEEGKMLMHCILDNCTITLNNNSTLYFCNINTNGKSFIVIPGRSCLIQNCVINTKPIILRR